MNNPNSQFGNQRPMEGLANQMATQGRYGDSMMVHMNPVEVAGLASLSPTGSLTRNPMTGQPEAFLPFLAPLLGGMLGSSFLTGAGASILGGAGLSAAAAGAVGSGLATTAITGDLKQGIMSGLSGYGLGKALQGASEAFDPAISEAAGALEGSQSSLDTLLKDPSLIAGGDAAARTATEAQIATLKAPAYGSMSSDNLLAPNLSANPIAPQAGGVSLNAPTPNTGSIAYQQGVLDDLQNQAGRNIGQNFMSDPLKFTGEFGSNLMAKEAIAPVVIGESARAQEMLEDNMRSANRKRQGEKDQELADAYARRDYAVNEARKDSALNNPYSGSYGYNQGGLTSINPQDYMRQRNSLENMGRVPVAMFPGGSIPDFSRYMRGAKDAVEQQRTVRPPRVVTGAELESEAAAMEAQGRDSRAGFGAEKVYFRDPLPDPVDPTDPPADVDPPNYELPFNPGKGGVNVNANTPGITQLAMSGQPQIGIEDPAAVEDIIKNNAVADAGNLVTGIGNDDLRRRFASNYGDLTVPIYNRNKMADGGIVSLANGGIPSMAPSMSLEEMNVTAYPDQPPRQVGNPQMGQGEMGINEMMSIVEEVKQAVKNDPDGSKGDQQRYGFLNEKLKEITAQIGQQGLMELMSAETAPTSMAEGGMTPEASQAQLLEQTTQAILGQLPADQAEIAINMFVDTYGSEVFAQLRDTVLKSVVPDAQTEGKIEGQGGGMDDQIMGMIGDQQPVAVSPDEYIVPADVVSGIGDGSSSAGADQLDEMLDRVRSTRTGTTKQPEPLQAKQGGVLPA